MSLMIVPITIADACEFVRQHHRHHAAPAGGLFACGVADTTDPYLVGVAIAGRPVARALQDGWTAEVTRVCVLEHGPKGACSALYAALWRAARALGWRRLITYTLPTESGASLRGAGWRLIGEAGGGSWSCPSRPRVDRHPTQVKLRWEVAS